MLGHARADLDVIIEDEVVVAVPAQQGAGVLVVEVLKLQHSLGPPTQHSCHKLINQLHHTVFAQHYETQVQRIKKSSLQFSFMPVVTIMKRGIHALHHGMSDPSI